MKKTIPILCAVILFGGFNVKAAPVSSNRAMDIAKMIFAAQPATKAGAGSLKIVWEGEDIATKASFQPAFYVIARDGGGFVIIAGDDNVQPVLAISETNHFKVEGMPDHVRWWMDRMKAYVRTSTEQSSEVQKQWDKYVATKAGSQITGEVTDKVEKLTPEWDQGNNDPVYFGEGKHIFNAKCPLDGTALSVTGCVATALAELLTYQSGQDGVSMPANASGTVGGYSVQSGYVAPAAYDLGTVYDWVNLRTLTNIAAVKAAVDANTSASNALLENLAQLMLDLGAMSMAKYSESGTGASINDAITGLINHMGFNKGAYYADASNYTSNQWIEKLKSEIDKRPVLYSGENNAHTSAHAFIFDGYGYFNDATVFHINFGWGGGDCNGYYYYDNLNTGNSDYSYNCGAVFSFYPKAETYSVPQLTAQYGNSGWPGIKVGIGSPYPSYIIYLCLKNNSSENYSGKLKFVKRTKDSSETELCITEENIVVESSVISSMSFSPVSITDITFGDRVVCYYQDGENWAELTSIAGQAVSQWPLVPAAFIKTKASYSKNDLFTFELINYNDRYAGTVWTFTDKDGVSTIMNQSDCDMQLTKAGTYKIEAAVAPYDGAAVVERIVTYITVN